MNPEIPLAPALAQALPPTLDTGNPWPAIHPGQADEHQVKHPYRHKPKMLPTTRAAPQANEQASLMRAGHAVSVRQSSSADTPARLITRPGQGTQLGRIGGATKNYAASLERARHDGEATSCRYLNAHGSGAVGGREGGT